MKKFELFESGGRPAPRIGGRELVILGGAVLLFALFLHFFAFSAYPSEWDLYLSAVGLWDGFHQGSFFDSTFHYGKWHSYGYIQLVYALASPTSFASLDNLYQLMNRIGFWASLACLPATWWMVRAGYGPRLAWPATILFILSPGFLEIAGGTHPVLLAMALLFAGTASIWSARNGWVRVAAYGAASVLFLAALMVRLEVVLGLPLAVLGPSLARDWRGYVRSAATRAIPGVFACVGFFLIRAMLVPHDEVQTAEFVQTWFTLDKLPKGIAAVPLAAGIITTLLGGVLVIRALTALFRRWRAGTLTPTALAPFLAPFAVAVIVFLFWSLNPLPARHFILCVLAIALLTALGLSGLIQSTKLLVAASLGLVALNQLTSVALGPVILKTTGYGNHRGWPYLLTAPSGGTWERRAFLKERWGAQVVQGKRIARGACGTHVIVSSPLSPPIGAALLEGVPYQRSVGRFRYESGELMPYERVIRPGQDFIVLERKSILHPPFPPEVLRNPAYRSYNFVIVGDDDKAPSNCRDR